MAFRHVTHFHVEFGDCDPAGIVYYPNFFRWIDAASRHFFVAAGVPLWSELEKQTGILGTPLVDAQASFLLPATYGDAIAVETVISEWGNKSFVMQHEIRRDDAVLVQAREVRIFARRHPQDAGRIQAVPAPDDIRRRCS
jgi:4-hydroxybenzoyl-CoA thioesterase